MPRVARKKSEECMYHVMCKSISEIDLFQCDEDRTYYLSLIKRYIEKFHCRIYAYCLMDNHVHMFINPCGYDISSFMLSLNTAYVVYYNRRYKRHGHLFQGRFASKIVGRDNYCFILSAYIHNNAKDLPGYGGREEEYRYSSYGIYTGARKDVHSLVDTGFLLERFSEDKKAAQERFRGFTASLRDTGIIKEVDEDITRAYIQNEYISGKKLILRYKKPGDLLSKIGEKLGEKLPERLRTKYSRETSRVRAFVTYILRVLGGKNYREICEAIGNMSISGVSKLCAEGFKLIKEDAKFQDVFNSLIYSE